MKPSGAVQMVLTNRSFTLRTTLGHSIKFEKDVPVNVPPSIVDQALAIGASTVSGDNPVVAPKIPDVVPVDPIARQRQIRMVVEKMVEANNRVEFTAGGNPKVAAVSARLDYAIDQRELKTVLKKINQEKEDDRQS